MIRTIPGPLIDTPNPDSLARIQAPQKAGEARIKGDKWTAHNLTLEARRLAFVGGWKTLRRAG